MRWPLRYLLVAVSVISRRAMWLMLASPANDGECGYRVCVAVGAQHEQRRLRPRVASATTANAIMIRMRMAAVIVDPLLKSMVAHFAPRLGRCSRPQRCP